MRVHVHICVCLYIYGCTVTLVSVYVNVCVCVCVCARVREWLTLFFYCYVSYLSTVVSVIDLTCPFFIYRLHDTYHCVSLSC